MTAARPLTVCHIITGLATGGAERMLHKLVAQTDRSRFRTVVVSLLDRGTMAAPLEAAGAEVHAVGLSMGAPSPAALARLVGAVRRARPDVVHGWMYHGNLAASLVRAVGATRAPTAWNVRASIDGFATMKRSTVAAVKLGARLSGRPRRIVYNSRESSRQHHAIGYASDRTLVIPNGFDCAQFAPSAEARAALRREIGVAPGALVVGNVARFDPMKDQAGLLRAFARVCAERAAESGGDADDGWPHLVLAGRGVDPQNPALAPLVAELGLAGRVHLLGERADVPALMAAFDVAVSASACLEGFPNAVGEAMACGVPCVVTDVGDAAWIVGDTGLVVPPRDPAALAGAIGSVLALGAEGRARLGAAGRARVREHFSIERITTEYETLYRALATGAP